MRFDNIGFFWQDLPKSRAGRANQLRPMPPIPETGWRPPTEFPNLSAAKALSIDVETKDLNLLKYGPGWGRNDGHIVGFSITAPGAPGWYFPIRHETQPEHNLDPESTLRWASHVLGDNRPKIGANLIYDLGWLWWEGVKVCGPMYDIQFAEALLNSEEPDVSLDNLSHSYLGAGKVTSDLYRWLSDYCGGPISERQRKNIYLAPPSLAGPYAIGDVNQPLEIMTKQWPMLANRGVLELFNLECKLIPLLVKMRLKGAPVDINKADQLYNELGRDLKTYESQLRDMVGMGVNPNSSDSMKQSFKRLGLELPVDKTGKVSFKAALLEALEDVHPFPAKVLEYRRAAKVRNTFVKGYILDSHVNGRIHCSFNPLKGEGGGTRSGRFSSSDPNLQNIPVRSDIGKRVREAFVSTKVRWRKWDYSQIEYRLLAHHAVGPGSEEIRATYRENPDTDYHENTIELVRTTGIEMERRPAKTINFGLIYGMSQPELQRRLGLSRQAGANLFKAYHKGVPFAKATMDAAAEEAKQFGYVTTILGRKSDFHLWVPAEFDRTAKALPFGEALMTYGSVERAFTHKALNRKLQGGAADLMKKAMVECYEQGIFDEVGIPLLTVHDELDFDDELEDPNHKGWEEMKHIMETCVKTNVPIMIDMKSGPNWGQAD